jgi:uncharacterized ferredoxin-like protein
MWKKLKWSMTMAIEYEHIQKSVLQHVAEQMCVAARTAPKTRGRDYLIVKILDAHDKKPLIEKMKEIAERDLLSFFARDAENIKNAEYMVLIGVKKETLDLDCGYCGFATCAELEKGGGVCAFNSIDLGIALGSCASLAALYHVDNRIMFSIGKAAVECGMLGNEAVQAIGIPLSATGKNPFFDRK